MDTKLQKTIDELIAQLGAKSYTKGKSWQGYDVLIPNYEKVSYIGLPYVILVKDTEARISTPDESMEYLNYTNPVDTDTK